jgi:hypothetical protein
MNYVYVLIELRPLMLKQVALQQLQQLEGQKQLQEMMTLQHLYLTLALQGWNRNSVKLKCRY